jgi:CDP-diacylglycerol---serine O-phosphatidyltransferase
MRPIRTISVFPTLLTLGNLVCGFFAIVVAARVEKPLYMPPARVQEGKVLMEANPQAISDDSKTLDDVRNVMWGGVLIFLAMVFDALDGYVARLARVASDFGAQLDSLSDLVTFGVAPGFLLVKMCPRFTYLHSQAVWVIAAAFAACAALRLARFNVETGDEDEHAHFTGLPSPAAAAAIAGFAIMFYTLRQPDNSLIFAAQIDAALQAVLPYFAVMLALLMVSRIRYPHVANQIFRGQKSFAHVVAVVFALVAVMVIRGYSVPIICCAFVFYGPLHFCWEKVVEHRQEEESIF